MSPISIIHNPRCSKSRQTLALLEENGISPQVRLYLQDTLSQAEIKHILKLLNLSPAQLLRKGESIYKELDLKNQLENDTVLIKTMAEHPKLIERPIVIFNDNKAVIGRPPEAVLEHL